MKTPKDKPFRVHMFNNQYYEKIKGNSFDFKSEWHRVVLSKYADWFKAKRRH